MEKAISEYAAEDVGSLEYFKLIITILDLFNRKQAEVEKQSQNFKELVSDYRVLQQSFDNLKGLYEDEKSKVEKAKERCIYFAKELQTAKAEIERLKYNLEAVLNERADHSEAIKEFAELVKANKDVLFNNMFSGFHFNVIINSLVKEMVGDAEC